MHLNQLVQRARNFNYVMANGSDLDKYSILTELNRFREYDKDDKSVLLDYVNDFLLYETRIGQNSVREFSLVYKVGNIIKVDLMWTKYKFMTYHINSYEICLVTNNVAFINGDIDDHQHGCLAWFFEAGDKLEQLYLDIFSFILDKESPDE